MLSDSAPEPRDLRKARALWAGNRFDEATTLFAAVADANPQCLAAQVDAARALGHRHEIDKAEHFLARAAGISGREDLPFLLGQTWRMIFREDRAIECLERYVASNAGRRHADALFELAVLYERRHQTEQCAEALRRVTNINPQYMEALILKARLYRREGDISRAVTALRRITKNLKVNPGTKAQAWAALADLADKAGDYAKAVEHMEQAKAILRAHAEVARRHASTVLPPLEAFGRSITAEVCQRWAENPEPENPARVAQLTGFPRSGTTLLENILDAHPEIVSSEEREVLARDIFGCLWKESHENTPPSVEAFDRIPRDRLVQMRARYLRAMEQALGQPLSGRLHLDKNPSHTLFLPGIWRLFPETKFLIALRDPRDVIVSCYFQYLPLNPNSVAFLSWESTAKRYALDMGLWLHFREQLPPTAWREVRYESLVDDLPGTIGEVFRFLGLEWDESVLRYREALAQKTVHSPTYLDVAQPIHRRAIGRWKNYEPWLGPHLEQLQRLLEALGY